MIPKLKEIRLHRHVDAVCFDFEGVGTQYLSAELALKFAKSLSKFARDIQNKPKRSESKLTEEFVYVTKLRSPS